MCYIHKQLPHGSLLGDKGKKVTYYNTIYICKLIMAMYKGEANNQWDSESNNPGMAR